MKIITSLLLKFIVALTLITTFSCSVESLDDEQSLNQASNEANLTCTNAQPESRLINNGTVNFEFEIISTTSGQIIEFINVAPGTSTSWTSFPEGEILFSIKSNTTGVSDMKTQLVLANCETYELEIMSNNTLATSVPTGI